MRRGWVDEAFPQMVRAGGLSLAILQGGEPSPDYFYRLWGMWCLLPLRNLGVAAWWISTVESRLFWTVQRINSVPQIAMALLNSHHICSVLRMRWLTHVFCKPTHFFFHSFIATMPYCLQTSFNSVMKDWADECMGYPHKVIFKVKFAILQTRVFFTLKRNTYTCVLI